MKSAILFDLDGTLLDTAPDLIGALADLARELDLPLPTQDLRPCVSFGTPALLGALGFDRHHDQFHSLRQRYLALYRERLYCETKLFEGMADLLEELVQRSIKWGIVTNKPHHLTQPLVEGLNLQPHCCISGDTMRYSKPHPAPLLKAANELGYNPLNCFYVGDILNDISCAKAAGMKPLIAAYGYGDGSDLNNWNAPLIQTPLELRNYLC